MPQDESVFISFYHSKEVTVAELEWARRTVLQVKLELGKRQSKIL